jgi:hypothetical protein
LKTIYKKWDKTDRASILYFTLLIFCFCILSPFSSAKAEQKVADCFQYYNFGSIKMDISGEKYTYASGNTITFKGKIANDNDSPVVDGGIYVKIYHRDPKGGQAQNGGFQVAEFYGLTNISLASRQTKDVEFKYQLPKGLANGEYDAQFFFEVGEKYNLSGLSFHVAEPGSTSKFSIDGAYKQAIYFDKDDIKVNGENYNFRAINKPSPNNKEIAITAPLLNPTQKSVDVTLEKEVFYWDSLNQNNKLAEDNEVFSLPPGQKEIKINYNISELKNSVYLFRLTAKSDSGQTVVNVRPAVAGMFQPRLNYVGLVSFPLVGSQKTVFFSCFHNTNFQGGPGKVVLTLKDGEGNIISNDEYNGQIPGEMIATAKEFIPQKNYEKAQLTAEIFDKDGKLIDSSNHIYDCSKFDPSICNASTQNPDSPKSIDFPFESQTLAVGYSDDPNNIPKPDVKRIFLISFSIAFILFIGFVALSRYYKKKKQSNNTKIIEK